MQIDHETVTVDPLPAGPTIDELDEVLILATADDLEPAGDYDLVGRVATAVVTGVPVLLLVFAGYQAWGGALRWTDLVVLFVCYFTTGFGITVGYHRLMTHRAFATGPRTRGVLAAMGCAAIEGPPIEWVANHRMHHAFSDQEGDPHSPHVGHGTGWRGALRGLAHAHLGWLFTSDFASEERYAPDLLADPTIRFVDRTFVLWVLVGLAVPFAMGYALTGGIDGALTALLWGGAVRIFLLHHTTFSINSLCHYFGRRRFETDDQSRNLLWLAPLSMGESWHNNHHAFPTSATHGMRWWELDVSTWVIRGLEATGLAWDVVRISRERQEKKFAPARPVEAAAESSA